MSRHLRSAPARSLHQTSGLVPVVGDYVKSGLNVSDAVHAALASRHVTDPAAFDTLRKAWQRSGTAAHDASVLRPHGQTLSVLQEEALVELVVALGSMGVPLSHSQLAAVASSHYNVPTDPAWATRFFARHDAKLRLGTPKWTTARRKAETTLEATERWVEFMQSQTDYLAAKPSRISNVDECRMSTQELKLLRLLFARGSNLNNVSRTSDRQLDSRFDPLSRSSTKPSSAPASCRSSGPRGRRITFSL
jgi:hypothetical protein